MLPLINQHLCVDQLIREVLDAQEGKQAIGDDLVDAFEKSDTSTGYVDLKIGKVIVSDDGLPGEEISLDEADMALDDAQLSRAMDMEDNWERYILLPDVEDYEIKSQLASFIDGLDDDEKKSKLVAALKGAGAITRAERLIKKLELFALWREYRRKCYFALARDFCEENRIEYDE